MSYYSNNFVMRYRERMANDKDYLQDDPELRKRLEDACVEMLFDNSFSTNTVPEQIKTLSKFEEKFSTERNETKLKLEALKKRKNDPNDWNINIANEENRLYGSLFKLTQGAILLRQTIWEEEAACNKGLPSPPHPKKDFQENLDAYSATLTTSEKGLLLVTSLPPVVGPPYGASCMLRFQSRLEKHDDLKNEEELCETAMLCSASQLFETNRDLTKKEGRQDLLDSVQQEMIKDFNKKHKIASLDDEDAIADKNYKAMKAIEQKKKNKYDLVLGFFRDTVNEEEYLRVFSHLAHKALPPHSISKAGPAEPG